MSIHIITIDLQTVSAVTGNIFTTVPLYGIVNDDIVDIIAFQESINRLIVKHETLINHEITEIHLVCNSLGFSVDRHSKIKTVEANENITYSNSFVMKTCKVYEFYQAHSLKIALNAFTNIGINVGKVWSVFSLFLLNANQIILREKITFMIFGSHKITLCNFDGAGSISSVYEFGKGVNDVIDYVSAMVKPKFGNIKKEVIVLILQNFIYFNEIEFIQKIHNTRYVKSSLMSSISYDVVHYISSVLREYIYNIAENIRLASGSTCYMYTQNEYTQNLTKIFSMVTSSQVHPLPKSLLSITAEEKKRNLPMKDLFSFLLNKK